ncbi:MAG: AsmA family protein [Pseudomonadota bacterium]
MKVIKILLIVAVLAVLVIGGGVAAFLATLDPNDYREDIVKAVKEQTGRDLTIEGDLELGLWPQIKFRSGPIQLSNAPGFGDEPFFAAREMRLAVATMPLLSERVEMDTLIFHGIRVNLAKNAAGVTNWDDLAGEPADASGGESQHEGGGGLAALILGGVDIQDTAITYKDETTGQDIKISDITVSTGPLTFGEPIEFKLSLSALANQPALDSDINLDATIAYDLDNERYTITPMNLVTLLRGKQLPGGEGKIEAVANIDANIAEEVVTISGLSLKGLGTDLSGELTATNIEDDKPSANGFISINGEDLHRIFKAFDLPVAEQLSKIQSRNFNFDVEFDANMDSGEVKVSKLGGNILGASLSGAFNATGADTDKPVAKGNVRAEGPDLPTLLAVIGQLQGADEATLKNLNAALRKTKDKSFLIAADLDANLPQGKAGLPTLQAKLLGNEITGKIDVTDAASDDRAISGSIKAQGPDLPALIAVAAPFAGESVVDIAASLAKEKDKAFLVESAFNAVPSKENINLDQLKINAAGVAVNGKLNAKGSDQVDGQLSVTSNNLGPLLRAVGQGDLAESVTALNVEAGLKGSGDVVSVNPLSLVATVAGKAVKDPVDLKVTAGAAQLNNDKGTLTVRDLSITGLGLNAKASIDAKDLNEEIPAFSGNFDVPVFNLRTFLKSLNQPVPEMADAAALTAVGLSTGFSGTSKSVALQNLNVKLDDTTIKGDVDVKDFAGPKLAFGIDIDTLNADRYLPPASDSSKAPAATPEAAAAGASTLPVETLRGLDIQGELNVGSLQLSGAKMKDIKFGISAKDGDIQLSPLGADLYEGNYEGNIVLSAKTATPKLGIKSALNNVSVEPLIKDTVGNDMLSGTVNFNAALNADGGDADAIKKTLNGAAKFNTQDGVFRGVDAAAVLRAAEQILECKCPVAVPKGGQTAFKTLGGTLNAKNGVVFNEDLVLAGDGFIINGQGMLANLHDNTTKYNLTLAVDESRQGSHNLGGYKIPIQCRGNIESPSCLPDLGGLIEEAVKKAAQKKVEEAVKKNVTDKIEDAVGDKAKDALKSIFKF